MSTAVPQQIAWADVEPQSLPGFDGRVTVKVLSGALGQVMRVEIAAGVVFPNPEDPSEQEVHPIEQILNVVSGCLRTVVAGREQLVKAGESLVMPAAVPHTVTALEDTVMLEVFAPPVFPA